MPFCQDCGSENAPDQKFCTNCGKPLQQSVQSPPAEIAPAIPAAPPKPASTVPIVLALVVVIAIIAAFWFFGLPLLQKNDAAAAGSLPEVTSPPAPQQTVQMQEPEEVFTIIPEETHQVVIEEPEGPAYTRYTSSMFGFSIDYPDDWTMTEQNTLQSATLTRYNAVKFVSPPKERCDTDKSRCEDISAVVTIEVETAPGTDEVADYYVKETTRLLQEMSATITKRDAMYKLSGRKAYRFDYETTNKEDKRIRLLSAYTIIDGDAYILTYRAFAPIRGDTDMFEKYYNEGDYMFSSFTV